MAIQSLTKDQLRALLAAARAHSEAHFLMILVALLHGLRASELCNLRVGDIQDGQINIRRLKGSRATRHELFEHPDPLFNEKPALLEFIGNQVSSDRIFPRSRWTFQRIMRRHGKTAGLPLYLLHPHTLKHSIAMILKDVMDIPTLQAFLGHVSGSSTLEYTKIPVETACGEAVRALRSV